MGNNPKVGGIGDVLDRQRKDPLPNQLSEKCGLEVHSNKLIYKNA